MDLPNFWNTLLTAHTSPINVLPLPEGAHAKNDLRKNNPFWIASFWISRSLNIFSSNKTRRILSSYIYLKISSSFRSFLSFGALVKFVKEIIYHQLIRVRPFFHELQKSVWISGNLDAANAPHPSNDRVCVHVADHRVKGAPV